MDDAGVKSLVRGWHARSRQENDLTTKFVFLWFCFNAWMGHESEEDTDREMLTWLKESPDSQLRAAFILASGSEVFQTYLSNLVMMSPLQSTGRRPREARVESPGDFAGIVDAVYQVRCNLFHGGKRANDTRDDQLVRNCARILEKWVGNLVAGWRT